MLTTSTLIIEGNGAVAVRVAQSRPFTPRTQCMTSIDPSVHSEMPVQRTSRSSELAPHGELQRELHKDNNKNEG